MERVQLCLDVFVGLTYYLLYERIYERMRMERGTEAGGKNRGPQGWSERRERVENKGM